MDEKKKRLVIGGVVGLSVVAILYLGLHSKVSSESRGLSDEQPKFDIKDLNNMTPDDGNVLVAYQGYVKYLLPDYGKKVYLALAPVSGISVTNGNERLPYPGVRLESERGDLLLSYIEAMEEIHIQSVSIQAHDSPINGGCYVKDVGIIYSANTHYECEKPRTFPCVRSHKDQRGEWVDVKVAEFTISAIRIEVHGNAADHKRGKFTQKAEKCI